MVNLKEKQGYYWKSDGLDNLIIAKALIIPDNLADNFTQILESEAEELLKIENDTE